MRIPKISHQRKEITVPFNCAQTGFKLMLKKMSKRILKKNVKAHLMKKSQINHPQNQDVDNIIKTPKIVEIEQFVKLLQPQNVNCSICLQPCIYPVLTQCGHFYCLPCFEIPHQRSNKCSVCRQTIDTDNFQISNSLQSIFEQYISTHLSTEQIQNYSKKRQDFLQNDKKRNFVEPLNIGDLLDIKKNNIWVECKVTNICESEIQIQIRNSLTRQGQRVKLNKNSRRLAHHQYKSTKKRQTYEYSDELNLQGLNRLMEQINEVRQLRAYRPQQPEPRTFRERRQNRRPIHPRLREQRRQIRRISFHGRHMRTILQPSIINLDSEEEEDDQMSQVSIINHFQPEQSGQGLIISQQNPNHPPHPQNNISSALPTALNSTFPRINLREINDQRGLIDNSQQGGFYLQQIGFWVQPNDQFGDLFSR